MADQPIPGEAAVLPNAPVTTDTEHTFGFGSFNKQTPMFAKNLFTVFYSMNTSVLAWLLVTKIIPPAYNVEIVSLFKFIVDPLCYIVSRMWGVSAITKDDK